MALFWILASLMTALALAFVLVPLLRARAPAGPDAREANLEVLRGQRREIDADVANGLLAAGARDEALAELIDRAGDDLEARGDDAPATAKKPWVTVAIVAVAIPAIAFGVYLALGSPGRKLGGECLPIAQRGGVVACVHGGGTRERERLLVMRIDGERGLRELEGLAGECPALRHAERVGIVGEDVGVAGDESREVFVGLGGFLETAERGERARE